MPNLGDYIVAGCRYGGPLGRYKFCCICWYADAVTILALMRDTTKLIALGRATALSAKAQIQVYSPAGESLLVFSVDA